MSPNDSGREAQDRVIQALSELSEGVMGGEIDPDPLPPAVRRYLRVASAAQLRALAITVMLALLEAESKLDAQALREMVARLS